MIINEILSEEHAPEITRQSLELLAQYADKLFRIAGLDINFTRHFFDRINDDRGGRPIKFIEVKNIFDKIYRQLDKGREVARLGPEAQAVLRDMQSDINMPFVLKWDPSTEELDLVFKTVMRKRNFMTSNPTLKVENKYSMRAKELLTEGGNVWSDVSPFKKEQANEILASLQKIMPKGIKLIKVGSAGHKDISGDMDVMVDEHDVVNMFKKQIDKITAELQKTPKKKLSPVQIARSLFKDYFTKRGFQAAQSGVNVHVRVPVKDKFAQVDIMFVEDAHNLSVFHQHDYNSAYKGKHKHMLLSSIAKLIKTKKYPFGLMWSAFQGLFSRGKDGKKDQFITRDPDMVARMLLNPAATRYDLGNVESILKAIPKDANYDAKIKPFLDDMKKEGA